MRVVSKRKVTTTLCAHVDDGHTYVTLLSRLMCCRSNIRSRQIVSVKHSDIGINFDRKTITWYGA